MLRTAQSSLLVSLKVWLLVTYGLDRQQRCFGITHHVQSCMLSCKAATYLSCRPACYAYSIKMLEYAAY